MPRSMFLFKCCANNSVDSRSSSFSHPSKKPPLQILIQKSTEVECQSPMINSIQDNNVRLLNGVSMKNTEKEKDKPTDVKHVKEVTGSKTSFKISTSKKSIDCESQREGVEVKLNGRNDEEIKEEENDDETIKLLHEVEKSLRNVAKSNSPTKKAKKRCIDQNFAHFGVTDKTIQKEHHRVIQRHPLYTPHQNPRLTNSCLALLTKDNRVVTSLVKQKTSNNSSSIKLTNGQTSIVNVSRDRFEGCDHARSHNLILYSLNDLRSPPYNEPRLLFLNQTVNANGNKNEYHFNTDEDSFALAVDNYIEVLRKSDKVINLNDYYCPIKLSDNLLTTSTNNLPLISSSSSSVSSSVSVSNSINTSTNALTTKTYSDIKASIRYDDPIDENISTSSIETSPTKPSSLFCDSTPSSNAIKDSSPSTNYYSSYDSDLWPSTAASSDYAATSTTTTTTTTTSASLDDCDSKESELSPRSFSSDLIFNRMEDTEVFCIAGEKSEEIFDFNERVNKFKNDFKNIETFERGNYLKFYNKNDELPESSIFLNSSSGFETTSANFIENCNNKINIPTFDTRTTDNANFKNENCYLQQNTIENNESHEVDNGLYDIINTFPVEISEPSDENITDFYSNYTYRDYDHLQFVSSHDNATYLDSIPVSNNEYANNKLHLLATSEPSEQNDDNYTKKIIEDEEDNYDEQISSRPIFKSSDDDDDDDNEDINEEEGKGEEEEELEVGDSPNYDPFHIQPQTRELESYFISEPNGNEEIVTVSSQPGTNVRNIQLYNTSVTKNENEQSTDSNEKLRNSGPHNNSTQSTKSHNFTDKNKNKFFHGTDDKYRSHNNSVFDFQRFYSKSTPNLNSEVDRSVSSLTLVEEYFSKYIIDCETIVSDETTTSADIESKAIDEGSNVDPKNKSSSPQENNLSPDCASSSSRENKNFEGCSSQHESIDKFTEICKKFSSTCLNIFQTSYPALHTTSESCPSISDHLKLDSAEHDFNSNPKSHSQSSATLSALYAAIFPTFDSSENNSNKPSENSSDHLIKETSVDDCALIGKPESTFKKPALVRRCLSLKAPENVPTTEVRKKKKVKFADAFGLELAIVRLILSGENLTDQAFKQRFQAASASYCNTNTSSNEQTSNSDTHKHSTVRSSCLKNNNNVSKHKTNDAIKKEGTSKRIIADFTQPGNHEDFSTKVWLQKVILESCLPEKNSNSISGCIRVYNLTYGKQVILRYTMNHWVTFEEHYASYIYGSNDGFSDRFSFMVNLPPFFDVGSVFEFAIHYRTNDGREFWDNNHGNNYRMICQKF